MNSIKDQLPELLSETVKKNIAANIVKQTKSELSGIHNSNYERIEKTVVNFAETKLKESEKIHEENAQKEVNRIIFESFKKVFDKVVLPH